VPKSEMYTTKDGERRFQVAAPVSEDVYEELRSLAYVQKTTVAAQVRQAVTEYVTRNRPPSSRVSPARAKLDNGYRLRATRSHK
jgi:hypothetical protein